MKRAHGSHLDTTLFADAHTEMPHGSPLDPDTRCILEAGLDVDLSAVPVHDSSAADALATSLSADAFAVGRHVFFRAGAYRPHTEAGLWLLAHEVTHSVQQARGGLCDTAPAHAFEPRLIARPIVWSLESPHSHRATWKQSASHRRDR